MNKFIFLVGGFNHNAEYMNDCEYYSIENNSWTEAPALKQKRDSNSTCTQGKFILTFGGYDGATDLKSIERLDAQSLLAGNS